LHYDDQDADGGCHDKLELIFLVDLIVIVGTNLLTTIGHFSDGKYLKI